MANPPQLLNLAFAGGIDESQRAEVLDPAQGWTTLENVRQTQRGAMNKRYGFSALTLSRLSGSRSAGYKLFALGLQACVIDGHNLDVYSPTAGVNVTRDRVPECGVKRIPIQYTGLTPYAVDLAYANGYLVAAATALNGSSVVLSTLVLDASTYGVLRQDVISSSLPDNTTGPRLAVVGNTVILTYYSAANTVSGRTLDTTSSVTVNTGWSGATSLASDVYASSNLTVFEAHGMSDRFALAYANNSGGASQLSVKTYNTSLTNLESTTVNTSSTTPGVSQSIAMAGSIADTLWVTWGEGSSLKIVGLDGDSLASVLATTGTVFSNSEVNYPGLVVTGTGTVRVVAHGNYSGTRYRMSSATVSISGGAATASSTGSWFWLTGSGYPFRVDGRDFHPVHNGQVDGENYDSTLLLVDVSEASDTVRPVANVAPGVSRGLSAHTHVASISSTKYAQLNVVQRTGTVTTGIGAGLELAVYDFADVSRWLPAADGNACYLSGGVPTYFDGSVVCEAGFVVRPSRPTFTTAAGTLTSSVGYRYVVVYEHADAAGYLHTSGVSNPSSSTGVLAGNTVTVSVPNLFATSRYDASNPVTKSRIALYRTTDGGSTYYRLTELQNSTSAAEQTYADQTPDATLTANAMLYRQPSVAGSAQDRRGPPAFRALTLYNDMLVGVADDGFTLCPSAQPVIGEGRWWSPVFQVPVTEGGEITALAAQDGTLFVFKRRRIFAVTGEAPSDNGASGGLGAPRRLAVDVGCIDPRSVVVTALGIFFQSERGIELLTRAQSVEWVGEPIQTTTSSYPYCTAATLDASENLVFFELASADNLNQVSGTGRTAVYDLALRAWVSTDRRKNQAGTADTPAQSAAIIYTGSVYRYAWLGTDGRIYVESRSVWLDPGNAWVTMRAESGWFKMSGLQGRQALNQVLVLAKRSTDHDLSLSLAYDYSDSYKTAQTWTDTTLDAVNSAWPRQQVAHLLHDDAEGQAMRVKLEDATPTGGTVGVGEGATWIALTIEGAAREGAARLPEGSQ